MYADLNLLGMKYRNVTKRERLHAGIGCASVPAASIDAMRIAVNDMCITRCCRWEDGQLVKGWLDGPDRAQQQAAERVTIELPSGASVMVQQQVSMRRSVGIVFAQLAAVAVVYGMAGRTGSCVVSCRDQRRTAHMPACITACPHATSAHMGQPCRTARSL